MYKQQPTTTANQDRVAVALERLELLESILTTTAFIILTGTMFLDVLSREVTGVGLHWARQVGVYANIVIVMFGLGLASANSSHLRPRFADGWLPVTWTSVLNRLQDYLMAIFCLVVAWFGGQVSLESVRLSEVSSLLPIVIWPILMVIPAAFFLTAVRHLAYGFYPALKPADSLTDVAAKG